MIAVHQNTPRQWTSYEIDLLEQISERCWAYIERARSDMKLRESEENFRQLANAMPQVVWTAKVNGQLDYINDRVYDYSGDVRWTEEGIDWLALLHPDDRASSMRAWAQCLATGALYEVEQRIFFKPTGTYRWNLTRAVPIRNEQGVIIKWFGANTDIEDQKRAADEIREAKEAAEGASIAKSEFLANMSHEIRTPMNAVIGLSHILSLSKPLSEKQKEYIHTLRLSADSLLALINDLLDISRIESHSIELERVSFSMVALVKDIFSIMNVRAQEKGLQFTMESECKCIEKRAFIGDIYMESKVGAGSAFTLSLPLTVVEQ